MGSSSLLLHNIDNYGEISAYFTIKTVYDNVHVLNIICKYLWRHKLCCYGSLEEMYTIVVTLFCIFLNLYMYFLELN